MPLLPLFLKNLNQCAQYIEISYKVVSFGVRIRIYEVLKIVACTSFVPVFSILFGLRPDPTSSTYQLRIKRAFQLPEN